MVKQSVKESGPNRIKEQSPTKKKEEQIPAQNFENDSQGSDSQGFYIKEQNDKAQNSNFKKGCKPLYEESLIIKNMSDVHQYDTPDSKNQAELNLQIKHQYIEHSSIQNADQLDQFQTPRVIKEGGIQLERNSKFSQSVVVPNFDKQLVSKQQLINHLSKKILDVNLFAKKIQNSKQIGQESANNNQTEPDNKMISQIIFLIKTLQEIVKLIENNENTTDQSTLQEILKRTKIAQNDAKSLFDKTKQQQEFEFENIDQVNQLNDKINNLKAQLKAQDVFISMIIHDMRSPVTAMIGITDQIMQNLQQNQQNYADVDQVSPDGRPKVTQIIQEWMELSELSSQCHKQAIQQINQLIEQVKFDQNSVNNGQQRDFNHILKNSPMVNGSDQLEFIWEESLNQANEINQNNQELLDEEENCDFSEEACDEFFNLESMNPIQICKREFKKQNNCIKEKNVNRMSQEQIIQIQNKMQKYVKNESTGEIIENPEFSPLYEILSDSVILEKEYVFTQASSIIHDFENSFSGTKLTGQTQFMKKFTDLINQQLANEKQEFFNLNEEQKVLVNVDDQSQHEQLQIVQKSESQLVQKLVQNKKFQSANKGEENKKNDLLQSQRQDSKNLKNAISQSVQPRMNSQIESGQKKLGINFMEQIQENYPKILGQVELISQLQEEKKLRSSKIIEQQNKQLVICQQSDSIISKLTGGLSFQAKMLLNLVNDLLDYGKFQNGNFVFLGEVFDLANLIQQNSFQIVQFQAQEKEISLSFASFLELGDNPIVDKYDFSLLNNYKDNNLPQIGQENQQDQQNVKNQEMIQTLFLNNIVGDERRYLQIMLNFLSNAIKFSQKKGKIQVNIKISDLQFIKKCESNQNFESGTYIKQNLSKVLQSISLKQNQLLKHNSVVVQKSSPSFVQSDQILISKDQEGFESAFKTLEDQKYVNAFANLIIEIADQGIGIKEENLNKLFMDFSKLDEQSKMNRQGTGLGLSISRKMVRQMGGDITVKSQFKKVAKMKSKINDQQLSLPIIEQSVDKIIEGWFDEGDQLSSSQSLNDLLDQPNNDKNMKKKLKQYISEIQQSFGLVIQSNQGESNQSPNQFSFNKLQKKFSQGQLNGESKKESIDTNLKFLVANDESFQLQCMSMTLKRMNFQVSEAENGIIAFNEIRTYIEQSIQVRKILNKSGPVYKSISNDEMQTILCELKNYDFIILDLNMPIMNGFEACERICEVYNYFKSFDDQDSLIEQHQYEEAINKLFEQNDYRLDNAEYTFKYFNRKNSAISLSRDSNSADLDLILQEKIDFYKFQATFLNNSRKKPLLVACSAEVNQSIIQQAMSVGFDIVIQAPLTEQKIRNKLIPKLKRVIKKKTKQQNINYSQGAIQRQKFSQILKEKEIILENQFRSQMIDQQNVFNI